MAFIPSEVFVSENQSIIAVKRKRGGYNFYVTTNLAVNGNIIEDNPLISNSIRQLLEEIVEIKEA